MATVNFSVPDEVKETFNQAFEGQNNSAIIADLMRRAVEGAERRRSRALAIARLADPQGAGVRSGVKYVLSGL